jgi:hypothetical protein
MKFSYIVIVICLFMLIFPVNASTAKLSWFNNTGTNVTTAVDTNSDGSLFFVGFANGTIVGYNVTINATDNTAESNVIWRYQTNATDLLSNPIKKIVSDDNGNIVWINNKSQSGYISYTGAVISRTTNNSNITDVALLPNGLMYATTELRSGATPTRIRIFNLDGTVYAQNVSFGTATNWTRIGYDASNQWLITANESSNRVYYWNITPWTGWDQFNTYQTVTKNASQQFVDTFPYRLNITVNSNTEKGIWFFNATNTTYFTKVADNYYFANFATTGRYFHWTIPNNLSNASNWSERPQNALLNMSSGDSAIYLATIRPGYSVYNIYFGNTTYSNQFVNQTWTNNGTLFRQNITSSTGSFPIPNGVNAVNLTMYGGGGGGLYGSSSSPGVRNGNGGTASALTQHNNVIVTPGTSASISIGSGGTFNTIGGTTTFTNSTGTSYSATGGAAGSGYSGTVGGAGNTSIPFYPTAATGNSGYDKDWNCIGSNYNPGSAGGVGYGAGGGGGGGYYGNCGADYPGAGGAGAAGVVQVSYYINDIADYYYGVSPSSSTLGVRQDRQIATTLDQTSVRDYVGPVVGISIPSVGGIASISTDPEGSIQGALHQQYISQSGFGYVTCSSVYAGTSVDVKASNSLSSIEARSVNGIIYDSNSVPKAFTATGGTLRSVDIAMVSGQLAALGGDDGKVYMLSRVGVSGGGWVAYYTGSGTSPVTGVATTWNGEAVVVTRQDGLVEYYLTNTTIPPTPTTTYVDVQLRVYKDGTVYPNQPVTILSSTSTPYSWTPIATLYTDGGGRLTYTTTVGTYYKFIVNMVPGTVAGEGERIWQSNPITVITQIYILSPSTPYEWNAYYAIPANNVTVVYSDTTDPTSIIVTITDLKTNLDVLTRTYLATPNFTLEYHDQLGNGSYQVTILINRLGTSLRDQRIVTSPNAYGSILPNDQYITWAISTFVLMLIAGMFSYSNSKRGALAVVVLAGLFMWLKLLPMTMVTVASLAAIFAVMSLFASRVQ